MENLAKRFVGKVAIITVSTQGIGFGIAKRFGLEGASVVISSRKQKNVDDAVQKLTAQGIRVLGLVCHVSNAQQRKNLIDQTLQEFKRIDINVSNAAANPSADSLLRMQGSLDKLWEVIVKTAILLQQDAAPHLQNGSSVLISSLTGYRLQRPLLPLADEMAPTTRVNCVAPGSVPTNFADALTKNEELRKNFEEDILLQRLGTTKDMAAAGAFFWLPTTRHT